jgi:hypothetical protein
MPAACNGTNRSAGAGAYQTATDCAVGGIVRICESGGRQQ